MNAVVKSKLAPVKELCRHYQVRRLELFGSGTRGRLRSDSDLDFLVEFQANGVSGHADRYFGLLEELESLFNRHVDLVETIAIRNPFFLEAIRPSRVLVYAA
jgi:predicted nucleotidyltransferase